MHRQPDGARIVTSPAIDFLRPIIPLVHGFVLLIESSAKESDSDQEPKVPLRPRLRIAGSPVTLAALMVHVFAVLPSSAICSKERQTQQRLPAPRQNTYVSCFAQTTESISHQDNRDVKRRSRDFPPQRIQCYRWLLRTESH